MANDEGLSGTEEDSDILITDITDIHVPSIEAGALGLRREQAVTAIWTG